MTFGADTLAHSLSSLIRVILGTGIAVILGISLGILRSQMPAMIKRNFIFNFFLDAIKYPPPIAWIPFAILVFGTSQFASISIVIVGAFAPIFTSSFEATEKIPQILRQTLALYEIHGLKKQKALLMTGLAQIFSGIKIGVGMGWMSVIAAEMIAGQSGLGYSIQAHRFNMQYEEMIFDMICIGFIGYCLNLILSQTEKYILVWHESQGS